MKKKWIIPIIILIIISIYGIITFPRSFIKKDKPILGINVSYVENIMKSKSGTIPNCSFNTTEEINTLFNILDDYHYRPYFVKNSFVFDKATSELHLFIYYNKIDYDCIFIYSDGSFTVNNKTAHIGLMGTSQSKKLYNTIYEQYKDKLK